MEQIAGLERTGSKKFNFNIQSPYDSNVFKNTKLKLKTTFYEVRRDGSTENEMLVVYNTRKKYWID